MAQPNGTPDTAVGWVGGVICYPTMAFGRTAGMSFARSAEQYHRVYRDRAPRDILTILLPANKVKVIKNLFKPTSSGPGLDGHASEHPRDPGMNSKRQKATYSVDASGTTSKKCIMSTHDASRTAWV